MVGGGGGGAGVYKKKIGLKAQNISYNLNERVKAKNKKKNISTFYPYT